MPGPLLEAALTRTFDAEFCCACVEEADGRSRETFANDLDQWRGVKLFRFHEKQLLRYLIQLLKITAAAHRPFSLRPKPRYQAGDNQGNHHKHHEGQDIQRIGDAERKQGGRKNKSRQIAATMATPADNANSLARACQTIISR